MSRFMALALAGTTAIGMSVGTVGTAEAAPLPALTGAQVGGGNATVEHVGWRRGYYGGGYGRGYGYRGYGYRRNAAGAAFAGAAIGLIGGAIAASAAPRYGYYGGGYGYPAYGYAPAGYGYGYGYPSYGYSYPAYGYGW